MRARVLLLFSLLSTGCGAEFDPSSEIATLRVLGVQKSAPYAKPGEQVELSMLWHDGSPEAPRPVEVAWFSGCFNPPADLFSGCIESFSQQSTGGGLPPGVELGLGDRFDFTMPADVISSRPPPADGSPPYGLAVVFFAVCAGRLDAAPAEQLTKFPLACYGPDDEPLGPEDFVAGYTSIYAYENIRNENPIINGFSFNGVSVTPSCIGDACLDTPIEAPDCAAGEPCIDPCADDGDDSCPGFDIAALVDPASAEQDEVAKLAFDRDLTEQMWVRYYVSDGSVDSEVKLVNDAVKGFNDDISTVYRATKESGTVSIWAVVQDNRGGSNWVRVEVGVR